MKTPFDAAFRVAERRLDKVRIAIGVEIERLRRIETDHVAVETAMIQETEAIQRDPMLLTDRYFVRARDRRARLAEERAATQAKLAGLRRKAADAYGKQIAIAGEIDRFRDGATREGDAAEQAAADDLAAAAWLRRARRRADPAPPPTP